MALVRVPKNKEVEMIGEFFAKSAFTIEGVKLESKGLKELEKLLRDTGYTEPHFVAYWFTGDVMNNMFGLTESNAYPEDLNFLVIPNYYNPIVKLQIGARWFDDIVCNNRIKQNAVDGELEPDFDCECDTDE